VSSSCRRGGKTSFRRLLEKVCTFSGLTFRRTSSEALLMSCHRPAQPRYRSPGTAAKYRNTTTAIRHREGLCGTLPCSATDMWLELRKVRDEEVSTTYVQAVASRTKAQLTGTDSYARHLAFDATAARSAAGGS